MTDWRRDEWKEVDRLLAAALDLPVAERDAYLSGSGASDSVLARVRRLLETDADARERIGESAELLAEAVLDDVPGEREEEFPPGSEIGPYRVIRELGRGGMGTVYLAERSDERYDRHVAVKVVKRGMDTDEVLHRFRSEARILARLEHPGIARMYDADATADGRPYLVLEHVEGRPIDAFCDAQRLSIEGRIGLFIDVCDAVSHAHAKLILHRDLKPSNILVAQDGPRLLDFGVAKVLDDGEAESRQLTKVVGARLTPEYAAPEQIAGGPISTASDVYALGVVLYELLTGTRPARDATRRPSTLFATAEGEQTTQLAMARHTTPKRLERRLQGDLDVILMKALHEDADRRYRSVEAFAADLRRHLDGYPVTARPDSVGYRVRKFVRRNRFPVLSGSGVGISIVLFAIGSALQQAQTARARDQADRERARAEEVASVLEDFFTGADFFSAERVDTLSVSQFLDLRSGEVIEGLADQPAVQGTLLRVLGTAQQRLGHLDQADSLLTRAISVLGPPAGETGELTAAKRDLAHVRNAQGRWDEARTLYEEVFAEAVTMTPADRAEAHHNVGLALINVGAFDSAAVMLDTARAILAALPELDRPAYASVLTMRAGVAQRLGDLGTALELSREARDVMVEAVGPDHPTVFPMEHNYAFMLYRSGESEAAVPIFESLVARYRVHVPGAPELGTMLQSYGSALRAVGRPTEALPVVREALEIQVARFGPNHPSLPVALDAVGATLEALERYDEALDVFREGLAVANTVLGSDHPGTAVPRVKVASSMCRVGEASSAEIVDAFADAEAHVTNAFPPGHPAIGDLLLRKGECFVSLGRSEEAAEALADALAAAEARRAPAPLIERLRRLLSGARAGSG